MRTDERDECFLLDCSVTNSLVRTSVFGPDLDPNHFTLRLSYCLGTLRWPIAGAPLQTFLPHSTAGERGRGNLVFSYTCIRMLGGGGGGGGGQDYELQDYLWFSEK